MSVRRSRIFEALLGVFLIGVALGIVFTVLNPQFAERMFENLRTLLGQKIGQAGEDPFTTFLLIFSNNTRVAIIAALGGFLFGIVPMGILFFNGFVVGIVMEYMYLKGTSLLKLILSIVPHGIVEIPAFAVAGVGGIEWYLEIAKGEGTIGERFKRGFGTSLKMLAISIGMLLVAAFIEAYITPKIAGL
ncbi:MAG: stage II sporulation protein M [Palaeococcus sp.]|nr:stage II sporulation protein M [Palaeococcus sp. (in: euryarchaeotes)]MCD6558879.1 stage II sporulation protein M [Palaeococcus sp. (in: euryarchaeotes)]